MVQWLGLCASTAGSTSLNPGWGAKISHATMEQKIKKKEGDRVLLHSTTWMILENYIKENYTILKKTMLY